MTDATPLVDDEPESRIAENILSLGVGQIASWGFAAVTLLMVPRYLGDDLVGQLALVLAIWSVLGAVMGLGSEQLITRETARDVDVGNGILSRALPLQMGVTLLIVPCVVAYILIVDVGSTATALLIVVGAGAVCQVAATTLIGALSGRSRIAITALWGVIAKASSAVAVVVVVLFVDQSVVAIALASAIAPVVLFVLAAASVERDPLLQLRLRVTGGAEVLRSSSGFLLLGGALILYREVDVVVIAALADDAAVGWYAQTDRLFGTMLVIPAAVATALFPLLSQRWVEDEEATLDLVRRVAAMMFILVLPISAGFVALGDELALTLFGSDFAEAGLVLKTYAVVLVPVSFTILMGTMCKVAGRERLWSLVLIASGVATIPLDLILVPWARDTLDNAAVAGAIAFMITETCALMVGLRKVVPRIIDRQAAPGVLKAIAAAIVMGTAVAMLKDRPIVIPIAAGAIIYPTLVIATGALRIDELATLGGPMRHLARFTRRSTDSSLTTDAADPPCEDNSHEP